VKYAINVVSVLCIGYPCLVLGYVGGAIASGFQLGIAMYKRHEDETLDFFTRPRT
jgi:hypothetical protein